MMGQLTVEWEGLVGVEREVAGLRQGDPEALAALLERYQNRLYRYLLRMVREPATAEDLFQQTWLRVAQNIRRYDPGRSFEAWLFSVARNLAIDFLRRIRPESLDEPAITGETAAERLPAVAPGALHMILERERAEWVTGAMDELPATYREVLTLRFEEEMKLEEIAEVMGTPLSTVKSRLRRALDDLRSMLEAKFPEKKP